MEPASQEESFRKMRWKGVENVGCLRDDQCVGQIKEKMSTCATRKSRLKRFRRFQRFLFTTCSRLHKKNEIKRMKKGGGHRIYNPRGLD